MATQNIHVITEDFKDLQEVSEAFSLLQKQIRYLQEHIDVENIISKSLTAEVIQAGSITAEEMTVNELSAITANLGTILAGVIKGIQIFGSYIATSESFPRTEMNVLGNFLAAMATASTYLAITPLGTGSVPAISIMANNVLVGYLNRVALGGTSLGTFGEQLNLQSGGNLNAQALGNVAVQASGNINLNPTNNLQIGGSNGLSGTFYVSTTPGGPAAQPITFKKGILIG